MKMTPAADYTADVWRYVAKARPAIEQELWRELPLIPADAEGQFNDALRYALFPGGKRLRPVLSLLAADLIRHSDEPALAAAAILEYVHTSSLILDDLPCMDNEQVRRGKASLHVQYGEGLALLVAIALLNASYGLALTRFGPDKELALRVHAELVECVGASRMIAGQVVDLAGNSHPAGSTASAARDSLCNLKTSSLIRLSLRIGALARGATEVQLDALSRFGELIGIAYQLSDDLLDIKEDAARAKPHTNGASSDGASVEEAQGRLAATVKAAKETISGEFGMPGAARLLCQVADYVATRKS